MHGKWEAGREGEAADVCREETSAEHYPPVSGSGQALARDVERKRIRYHDVLKESSPWRMGEHGAKKAG